jgi:hypothetical protein
MPDPLDMTLRELLTALLARVSQSPAQLVPDPERWLDLRADDLPVNARLVWAAAKRGELDVSRVGNATLVKARELDRWLQLQRVKPVAPKKQIARTSAEPPSSIAHLVGPARKSRP